MLNKFSAQSGCDTRRFSVFTPIDSTSEKSRAFSTSRYAQYPANRINGRYQIDRTQFVKKNHPTEIGHK